jgi:hypothetical protein
LLSKLSCKQGPVHSAEHAGRLVAFLAALAKQGKECSKSAMKWNRCFAIVELLRLSAVLDFCKSTPKKQLIGYFLF